MPVHRVKFGEADAGKMKLAQENFSKSIGLVRHHMLGTTLAVQRFAGVLGEPVPVAAQNNGNSKSFNAR